MSHDHEYVWERDRREARGQILVDRKHDVQDLCRWTCEYVERAAGYECADRQREARGRLQDGSLNKYWIEDRHSTIDVAEAYFEVFNDLFFFGSLEGKCIINVVYGAERLLGVTLPLQHRYEEGTYASQIDLSPKFTGEQQTDMIMLLEILLHEMCHAFFQIYACGSPSCYRKREGEGLTEHGRAWERLARAVQTTANQDFNLMVDLQIERSVIKEDNAWKTDTEATTNIKETTAPYSKTEKSDTLTSTNDFWSRKVKELDTNGGLNSGYAAIGNGSVERRIFREFGGSGSYSRSSTERRI